MTTDQASSSQYLSALAKIIASLRLKDVLDSVVVQFALLLQVSKIAVFLSDNQGKAFRLMAAKGYSELSLQQMKAIPFGDEGVLGDILNTAAPIILKLHDNFIGFNRGIFDREQSVSQIALPLRANGFLVGAILLDSSTSLNMSDKDIWQLITTATASTIANAIIFGRSEYERERLNTLYKTLAVFQDNVLNLKDVLQKTADAALVLGNTPYCAVLLSTQDKQELSLAAFKGLDGASLADFDMTGVDNPAAKALTAGKTQNFGQPGTIGMPRAMGGGLFSSTIALPLIYKDEALGVLEVFSTDANAFQQEQIELLESLSSQASNAIFVAKEHQSVLEQIPQDPHTGLLNRLYFKSALKTEVERSQRHGHEFALLLIDIDYLSRVNDRLGEAKGDEVIVKIAQTIKGALREIDLVYRFGGEQFAVILPETPQQSVNIVVDRLREKIRNTLIPDVGTVTVSMGISTYPHHSKDANDLDSLAEQALFIAKYKGRDRVIEVPIASMGADTNAWNELAKHSKQAVSLERQERDKSHLSNSADYANWLLKVKNGTSKNIVNKAQIPLP